MSNLKWAGRVALVTIIRRITYLALALVLGYFGMAKAHAQSYECSTANPISCDQGQAYRDAVAMANELGPAACRLSGGPTSLYTGDFVQVGGSAAPNGYTARIVCSPGGNTSNVGETAWVAGKTCSTRPAVGGMMFNGAATGCGEGCTYNAGPTNLCLNGDCTNNSIKTGSMTATNTVCKTPPVAKPRTDDYCIDVGDGHKQCSRSDGKICVISRSGTQTCWNPTENNCKVSGKEAHCKGPPPVAPPTVPPPPNPDGSANNWTPDTTKPATVNNTTNNITTSVSSGGGTNTDGSGPGQGGGNGPGDGGGTGGGDGDGDDGGTATGGGTCAAPPTCSGDAILCAINEQTWLNRCASDTGTDTTPVEAGDDESPVAVITDEDGPGEDGLDTSGFGWARACPVVGSFDVFGHSFNFDQGGHLCEWLQIGGALVLLMAAIAALRILAGAV